jgi:isopentenyl diphosphate isomerase/L-lactate dehydrogenase-like FMN-dependent dehydrogenase
MIGRSYAYGVGAMGEAGVTRCLQLIARELDLSMAFCGKTRLDDVNRSILWPTTSSASGSASTTVTG